MSETRRILLVEDDADIRRVTRATLKGAGYEVLEAENGRRGIELVRDAAPDLVVLDVMMPEMNGAEFCRTLVNELKLPDLPVLILSSVNEKSGLVRSLAEVEMSRREFLKKPVGPVELKMRVASMLDARPAPGAPAPSPPPAPARPAPVAIGKEVPRATLAPRSGPPPAARPETAGPRLRVLLVDDDRDLLAINRFALGNDYDVATAENGLDGLEMMELFDPDFVIVDYNMPSMDGMEMVGIMRRHPHFHHTPALFLTGNHEKNLPHQAYDAGGNLFLRKPIEPARLRRAIAHFVAESGLRPRAPGGPPAERPAAQPAEAPPARMTPPTSLPTAAAPDTRAKLRPRTEGGVQPAEPVRAAPAPKAGGSRERVRVLVVEAAEADARRLGKLIESGFPGRVDVLVATEHREALGQLARWEPDLILYDPRNPGLDGIAFFQLFKIKKLNLDVEFAFAGREFSSAEAKYSRQSFGRETIDLSAPDGAILYEIQAMVARAEGKARPKRHTIEELRAEDRREEREQAQSALREARQREAHRLRFSQIQRMLDEDG